MIKRLLIGVFATVLLSAPVLAEGPGWIDAVAVEGGIGDDDVGRFGLSAQFEWGAKWFAAGDWYLGGYWDLNGSYWDGDDGRSGEDSLFAIGLTPVFRVQPHSALGGWKPYVEFGVGPHLQSETGIGNKDFDINFAFGSHLGVGARFGARQQYELGFRYQHLSNASIGDSNPGINFSLFRLGYHF